MGMYSTSSTKVISLTLSLAIFVISLAGIASEKWAYATLAGVRVYVGLWMGVDLSTTDAFSGMPIARGTAVVSVVIAFVSFLMAAYSYISTRTKHRWFKSDLDFGQLFASSTCCVYSLIASIIYTRYISDTVMMAPSLALFWTTFCLSFVHSAFVIWVYYNSGKSIGRVDVSKHDENQDRGNWDSHAEFLLSMIGYAVGLGNVWRFPYLCYENGGGAFLIPYVIMLIFVGLPVFFMEFAVGQFDSRGPIESWNICPAFRGIGWMMCIYSALTGVYYNVIIAYATYYFFSSIDTQTNLEQYWLNCGNHWNTGNCTDVALFASGTVTSLAGKQTPSEQFWLYNILETTGNDMSAEGSHEIVWEIVIALIVAWTVVFFALMKGIKSSGKVVWFTALFPYLIIVLLLIRGCLLEGYWEGLDYYIGSKSDMSKLKEPKVWKDAATQIFFSLSAGWGGAQALSSYNNFKNNCFRDSMVVATVNCLTSFVAGFAIFSILGYMAHTYNLDIDPSSPTSIVGGGFGLAFIVYPAALANIPAAPFWACLFFLMLFTLGLDSQFTILETVSTALCDHSDYFKKNRTRTMGLLSVSFFLIALLCCTRTGLNWVNLIDNYTAGWAILMSTLLEVIVLGTVYGGGLPSWMGWWRNGEERLVEDIEMMLGKQSNLWWFFWRFTWYVVSPIIMFALLIWNWATYSDSFVPQWPNGIGWLIVMLGVVFLPVYFVIEYRRCKKEGKHWKVMFEANDKWGPCLEQHRTGRYAK